MTTQPRQASGEAPLDAKAVARVLAALGEDMILVGGQALAFWMARFDIQAFGAAVTNDADVIGDHLAATRLATALHSQLLTPPQSARTAIVAQVRIPKTGRQVANVDVLHQLFSTGGLRQSGVFTRRVVKRSILVQHVSGARFRVMEPFDMLDSRIQNAAGLLADKGPHVLTQARWAVQVAQAALNRLAQFAQPGPLPRAGGTGTSPGAAPELANKRLGQVLADLVRLAHSRAGRAVWKDHRIDVLAAVDVPVLASLSPGHLPQLEKIRSLQARRT